MEPVDMTMGLLLQEEEEEDEDDEEDEQDCATTCATVPAVWSELTVVADEGRGAVGTVAPHATPRVGLRLSELVEPPWHLVLLLPLPPCVGLPPALTLTGP